MGETRERVGLRELLDQRLTDLFQLLYSMLFMAKAESSRREVTQGKAGEVTKGRWRWALMTLDFILRTADRKSLLPPIALFCYSFISFHSFKGSHSFILYLPLYGLFHSPPK